MVVLQIHAIILTGKALEMEQTTCSLIPELEKEDGCFGYCVYRSINDPSKIIFYSEWETKTHLGKHLYSRMFAITSGAIHNLCESVYFSICNQEFTGTFYELKDSLLLLNLRGKEEFTV